ncbi:MAG: MFS transporter, partial [Pseudomonadota bacterium]|nr:MFS transporter [Pseudomonadota bacterium]
IALGSKGAPPNINTERIGLRDQYHFSPVGVVGAAAAGFTNAPLMGLGPIFGAKIGLGVEGVSYFMAIFLLGSLALQIPIGRLSNKYDRRGVLIGVAVASAVACAAMTVLSTLGTWAILATSFTISGLSAVVYPIAMAHANDHANPEAMVSIMAGLLLAFSVGASISPFFAALAMKWVGPVGLYLYCSVIYASLAGFTYYRRMRRVPALRDYRLRGTAADLAVERCRCRPRSKGRRYRIARAGLIPCTKGRGDLPGEDRLPNPFRPLENHRHP